MGVGTDGGAADGDAGEILSYDELGGFSEEVGEFAALDDAK